MDSTNLSLDKELISAASPVDVRTVGKLHAQLNQKFKSGNGICLRLAVDAEVDLTFVQLLEAARRVGVSDSAGVVLEAPASGMLRSILDRGGFLKTAASRAFWLHEAGTQ